MKGLKLTLPVAFIMLISLATPLTYSQIDHSGSMRGKDSLVVYQDGIYEGESRAGYTDEPYWGKVRVTIENGTITGINYLVRDSNLHETFSKKYRKHFKSNPEYVRQCLNDWKGVKTYPKKFKKTRETGRVDAVTGATWSYNIFKASLNEALKKAIH